MTIDKEIQVHLIKSNISFDENVKILPITVEGDIIKDFIIIPTVMVGTGKNEYVNFRPANGSKVSIYTGIEDDGEDMQLEVDLTTEGFSGSLINHINQIVVKCVFIRDENVFNEVYVTMLTSILNAVRIHSNRYYQPFFNEEGVD